LEQRLSASAQAAGVIDAFIYSGTRTAFGKHGGALAHMRPDDLLACALREVVKTAGIEPTAIDDVVIGCANQAGEDSRNVARHAALLAGLPVTTPALTVNRLCGSGLSAIAIAAGMISAGQAELILAGGVESMSRAPFVLAKPERAFDRNLHMFDSTVGSRFPNAAFTSVYGDDSNPQVGDNIAREYAISRDRADAYALLSQQRYANAAQAGRIAEELTTHVAVDSRSTDVVLTTDEFPRPGSSLEGLGTLKPLDPAGVVTAGNASGINDGAAVVVVGSRAIGERFDLRPLARIDAVAVAAVAPRLFGIAPVPATELALKRADLSLAHMDVIEINEAFATQVLACLDEMGIAETDARVNPNGGAIAVGHPLGASGARLAFSAALELRRRGGRFGLVTLCIGVGQGIAMIIERSA
jgi:acetyl-CoA acetyltransferase family protein